MTETGAARRRDDDGRRGELVAAAARVIARDGVSAATTRRIAAEAGLPLGTLHYWFSGKDELLADVIAAALIELESAAATAYPNDAAASPASILDAFRAAWKIVEDDDPGHQLSLFELTTTALRTPALSPLAVRQYELYRRTAEHSAAPWLAGSAAELPGGLDALARLIAIVFDGTTIAWLADPEGTRPDEVFQLLSHLLANAAPAAVSASTQESAAE